MKKMKKLLAMLMALTMVLGMTMTASAETTTVTKPSADDKMVISATNIAEDKNSDGNTNLTVKAYKIIGANYTENGFTGYSWESGCGYASDRPIFNTNGTSTKKDDFLNLTDVELATLAKEKTASLSVFDMAQDATTKTTFKSKEPLAVGTYMILVTGSSDEVYNPMIASVFYAEDGSGVTTGEVNADAKWTLVTNEAYAKSTDPSVDKVIVKADNSEVKGDDGAFNEHINFKVTGTLPSYSKQYTKVKYDIIDTLSSGLDFVSAATDVVVKVNGESVTASDGTYTVDITGKVLTVSFASSYILDNGLKAVEVTYTAKFNENANLNYNANTNTVYAEYSNDPSDSTKKERTPEVVTYHYTFGIDASLLGENVTSELFKTDEGVIEEGKTEKTYEYLNGAEFKLTRVDTPANYTGETVYTTTTGAGGVQGDIQFKGLDAGTYTLEETKAPVGYQLDTTVHKVTISATYNSDGTLESYSVVFDEKDDSSADGTSTYVNKAIDNKVDSKDDIGITAVSSLIKNTKLIALPSTGGIGTTIFTVAGCGIMIAAAFFFFASRKKEN